MPCCLLKWRPKLRTSEFCLAVWLSYSGRGTTDKISAIILPITAFVTVGFEHSIANMYFLPIGLLIKTWAPESFWHAITKTPADYPQLTIHNVVFGNLLPVTIGNVIGGALLVGIVYWFVYLRQDRGGRSPKFPNYSSN